MTIKFDHHSLGRVLKGIEVTAVVRRVARDIAANVEAQSIEVGAFAGGSGPIQLPVHVIDSKTDRAHSSVVLAHPAGIAAQAKYGALTKAASAAGFSVKGG